jgi:hypothetical protein
MNDRMTSNWLEAYLTEAVRKELCTKILCTTCGALEFRQGVLSALTIATGQRPRKHIDQGNALEITRALAEIRPHGRASTVLEDGVRCILFDLWSGAPLDRSEIEMLLTGTWAGDLLRRMKEHHNERERERREHAAFQDPASVKSAVRRRSA